MDDNLKEQLKAQIEVELDFCNEFISPVVCGQLGDAQQKATLIETIATTAIQGRMSISQAINEVERSYSNSDLD